MRRVLYFAIVLLGLAASAAAQATITLTPTTTYQVWKGFSYGEGYQQLAYTEHPSCTVDATITAAQRNQIWDLKIQDLGETGNRIDLYHNFNIEASANDNTDPNNTVQSSFDSTLNAAKIFPAGCAGDFLTDVMTADQAWRARVAADGEIPKSEFDWFFIQTTGQMPTWWATGSPNSIGCGVDEAAEATRAVITWMHNNYSFYPEYVTWNEPTPPAQSGDMFNAEAATYTGSGCTKPADWYGGWINSTHTQFATASIPTKISAPTPANCHDAIANLNAINLVAGAEANISRLSFHNYANQAGCNATDLANIWTRAQADGIDTYSDESQSATAPSGGGPSTFFTFDIARQFLSGTSGIVGANTAFFDSLTNANVSSWLLYNSSTAGLCNSTCLNSGDTGFGGNGGAGSDDGIMVTSTGASIVTTPFFWGLRQFGKYVRVGYTRVAAASSGTDAANVISTAWKRPDATQVIVAVNNKATSVSTTITGINNAVYAEHKLDDTLCTTTGASRCTPDDSSTVTASSNQVTVTIPGHAIWTLTQQQATQPTVNPGRLY